MLIKNPRFAIAPVDENHLPEILWVYQQCEDFLALGPVPTACEQMVLADLTMSRDIGSIFCGIYVDGQVVGVVEFVPCEYEGNPCDAYLSLLMIAKPYRRGGLGKQVVAAVEAYILQNPYITTILSGVQVNNTPAIAFWTGLGYQITSGPELLPDTTTVYHLAKQIR